MAFIKQFKSQIILTAAFLVLIGVGIAMVMPTKLDML